MDNMWERDYLFELFPPPYFRISNSSESPVAAICSHQDHVGMIDTLLSKDKKIAILIHISDEHLNTNKVTAACARIYHRFELVLRQYAFHETQPNNLLQIPLGFMTKMLRGEEDGVQHHLSTQYAQWSLSHSTELRKYKWSFIGGFHGRGKKDRETAVHVFSSWLPHYFSTDTTVTHTSSQLKDIYNNSQFTIVGRGWYNLDCFRVYESIISGSIPVIVGPNAEVSHAFAYNGHPPPVIHAESWDKALSICELMKSADIDKRREELVKWYIETNARIHDRIWSTLRIN